jgi:hypothetical protein
MTRRWLLRALFVVLVAGGVILITSGLADERSERVWTGIGLVVGSLVCLVLLLARNLGKERSRLDIVLAHPDAVILFGQLDDALTGAPSALVADTTSVKVLATRDRAVSVEIPWRDVAAISIRAEAVPGGDARALLVHRVAADTLTFWVERSLTPAHLADLEAIRAGASAPYAGTSHSPANGGSVSSTDAGRPPNGSSEASTEP